MVAVIRVFRWKLGMNKTGGLRFKVLPPEGQLKTFIFELHSGIVSVLKLQTTQLDNFNIINFIYFPLLGEVLRAMNLKVVSAEVGFVIGERKKHASARKL